MTQSDRREITRDEGLTFDGVGPSTGELICSFRQSSTADVNTAEETAAEASEELRDVPVRGSARACGASLTRPSAITRNLPGSMRRRQVGRSAMVWWGRSAPPLMPGPGRELPRRSSAVNWSGSTKT
jgi:hypothetical protein